MRPRPFPHAPVTGRNRPSVPGAEPCGKEEFTLAEIYAFEDRLSQVYPGNNNVRPKIRQQLQVLRDNGFLEFLGAGRYRLR
ncbi:hypothetical protein K1T73_11855 [Roseovarius sp. SCSIO 43702]|nr:hypothetical protein K1T73_11855 [Roseovarius sp. SCSIO 43702]